MGEQSADAADGTAAWFVVVVVFCCWDKRNKTCVAEEEVAIPVEASAALDSDMPEANYGLALAIPYSDSIKPLFRFRDAALFDPAVIAAELTFTKTGATTTRVTVTGVETTRIEFHGCASANCPPNRITFTCVSDRFYVGFSWREKLHRKMRVGGLPFQAHTVVSSTSILHLTSLRKII